jgi:hypothetical protein
MILLKRISGKFSASFSYSVAHLAVKIMIVQQCDGMICYNEILE